jgi:dephospho-CoA kinase
LVFVDAPRDTRLARAQTRGWSDAEFSAREAAQLPVAEKRRQADAVIDNGGLLAATVAQVEALWQTLE